jgi:hypothetical protein
MFYAIETIINVEIISSSTRDNLKFDLLYDVEFGKVMFLQSNGDWVTRMKKHGWP